MTYTAILLLSLFLIYKAYKKGKKIGEITALKKICEPYKVNKGQIEVGCCRYTFTTSFEACIVLIDDEVERPMF